MFRKLLVILLVLGMLLCGCAKKAEAPAATAAPTDAPVETVQEPVVPKGTLDKDLVILYTNDVHGGYAEEGAMGYAGLAALKKTLEDAGNYVLLADAGDALQGAPIGTISKGEFLLNIMNEVGYDVATVGNHEFDYGMDRFLELRSEANFPYVSSNFIDLATGKPVLDSYKVFEFNGVKVAFVGASTPETITKSTPAYFQNDAGEYIYGFCAGGEGQELYANLQATVDAARAEGAQYVILLGHLGIDTASSPWTSSEVITNTNGIDAVIDGHSHSLVDGERVKNKDGASVLLTQTGTKLNNVGMLIINKTGFLISGLVDATQYPDVDEPTKAFIDGIVSEFDSTMKTVVAKSEVDLVVYDPTLPDTRLVRRQETNLGDLCADAYRAMADADIAFVNGGGIRANLAKGDLTYEAIITVHPFGNALCKVEATGEEILQALEMGARALPEAENGGFLHVSGLTYEINTKIKSPVQLNDNKEFIGLKGANRVQNVKVGDAKLDLKKTYTLASHNYMLKDGGDGFTMFRDNVLLLDSVMLDNQVLINYIVESLGGVVGQDYADPYGQGRIVVK